MTLEERVADKIQGYVSDLYNYWSLGVGMSYLTCHDFEHCNRIYGRWLNFKQRKNTYLNDNEIYILELAIFLHDIGCIISRKEHPLLAFFELYNYYGDQLISKIVNKNNEVKEKVFLALIVAVLHDVSILEVVVYDDKYNIKSENDINNILIDLFPDLKHNNVFDQGKGVRLHALGAILSLFDSLDDYRERIKGQTEVDLISIFENTIIDLDNKWTTVFNKLKNITPKPNQVDEKKKDPNFSKEVYNSWFGKDNYSGSRIYWMGLDYINNIKIHNNDIIVYIRNIEIKTDNYLYYQVFDGLYKIICENILGVFKICKEICSKVGLTNLLFENIILKYKKKERLLSSVDCEVTKFKNILANLIWV